MHHAPLGCRVHRKELCICFFDNNTTYMLNPSWGVWTIHARCCLFVRTYLTGIAIGRGLLSLKQWWRPGLSTVPQWAESDTPQVIRYWSTPSALDLSFSLLIVILSLRRANAFREPSDFARRKGKSGENQKRTPYDYLDADTIDTF